MAMFSTATMGLMNNREKINYLKRYKILDREIDRMVAEVERLRIRLGKLSPTFSDMPVSGGSIYKSCDLDIINKIVDVETEINKGIDELIDIRHSIEQLINSITDDREKLLMRYRYIDGQSFEWIASEMKYHWRSVHKIHVRALSKIIIGQ